MSSEQLGQSAYEIMFLNSLLSPRMRRGVDLKEGEFITLALLERQQTMSVGEIQRRLSVLPAQMSRIVRSLEGRTPPLIRCDINPRDKRKIDVRLTDEGKQMFQEYRRFRTDRILSVIGELEEAEQHALVPIVDHIRTILRRRAEAEKGVTF